MAAVLCSIRIKEGITWVSLDKAGDGRKQGFDFAFQNSLWEMHSEKYDDIRSLLLGKANEVVNFQLHGLICELQLS